MPTYDESLTDRYALARRIVREAGDLTLEYFRNKNLNIDCKSDGSPVTVADESAEALLRERIQNAFPEDGIVGEEHGSQKGSSPWRWVLDPIDGTKSFVSGVPLYGTLIGIEHEEEPHIGVIHIPAMDECVHAAKGKGAWHDLKGETSPAQVGSFNSLSEGLLVTTEYSAFEERDALDVWKQIEGKAKLTRTWGDCYGFLLVATGRAVAMVDPVIAHWDISAVMPVILEAGGRFTDWKGRPSVTSGDAIGTAPGVFDEILNLTKEIRSVPQ